MTAGPLTWAVNCIFHLAHRWVLFSVPSIFFPFTSRPTAKFYFFFQGLESLLNFPRHIMQQAIFSQDMYNSVCFFITNNIQIDLFLSTVLRTSCHLTLRSPSFVWPLYFFKSSPAVYVFHTCQGISSPFVLASVFPIYICLLYTSRCV